MISAKTVGEAVIVELLGQEVEPDRLKRLAKFIDDRIDPKNLYKQVVIRVVGVKIIIDEGRFSITLPTVRRFDLREFYATHNKLETPDEIVLWMKS